MNIMQMGQFSEETVEDIVKLDQIMKESNSVTIVFGEPGTLVPERVESLLLEQLLPCASLAILFIPDQIPLDTIKHCMECGLYVISGDLCTEYLQSRTITPNVCGVLLEKDGINAKRMILQQIADNDVVQTSTENVYRRITGVTLFNENGDPVWRDKYSYEKDGDTAKVIHTNRESWISTDRNDPPQTRLLKPSVVNCGEIHHDDNYYPLEIFRYPPKVDLDRITKPYHHTRFQYSNSMQLVMIIRSGKPINRDVPMKILDVTSYQYHRDRKMPSMKIATTLSNMDGSGMTRITHFNRAILDPAERVMTSFRTYGVNRYGSPTRILSSYVADQTSMIIGKYTKYNIATQNHNYTNPTHTDVPNPRKSTRVLSYEVFSEGEDIQKIVAYGPNDEKDLMFTMEFEYETVSTTSNWDGISILNDIVASFYF